MPLASVLQNIATTVGPQLLQGAGRVVTNTLQNATQPKKPEVNWGMVVSIGLAAIGLLVGLIAIIRK